MMSYIVVSKWGQSWFSKWMAFALLVDALRYRR